MKKIIKLKESELKTMISETVKKTLNEMKYKNISVKKSKSLNEGVYDYPDTIDELILDSENDRECYDYYWSIVQMLKKKLQKGIDLSVDVLANSSIMKKYQQFVFRKFGNVQMDRNKKSPLLFRQYISQRIIERLKSGEY